MLRTDHLLHVATARISYAGPDRIDVTRAGADKSPQGIGAAFAPSRELLNRGLAARRRVEEMRQQAGDLFTSLTSRARLFAAAAALADDAWTHYSADYCREMEEARLEAPRPWARLLDIRPRVVLVCYCTDPARCHRRLLAGILRRTECVVDDGELSGESR